MNFRLMHQYGYNLSDLEQMMPWERKIYLTLLNSHIKEENMKREQEIQRRKYR
tara:strand:- start:285 stop:443 length:159 start_codon:yes stop_codon:yes gene_type:complete